MGKIDIRYLAGFFDGEGCFYIGTQKKKDKTYPKAQILLGQSGEDGLVLLQDIQKEYGGNLYLHLKPGQSGATKNAYKLWWNKLEGIILITKLLPHLKLKQQEARNVLNYLTRK